MNVDLVEAIKEIEREKGINADVIFQSITESLLAYYKKNMAKTSNVNNISVSINKETGQLTILEKKTVAEEVEDAKNEISLEEARQISHLYQVGDLVEIDVTPKDFGRVVAQSVKNSVIQKVREAERDLIYDEYIGKEGDIVNGVVQRIDNKTIYVDLGKVEAVLLPGEQMDGEYLEVHQRIKAYVLEVKKTTKGPQIVISRSHPGLLKRMFELEVPEIHDGIVEIKSIAREAGSRSKIAVHSSDENVDPIGACVGPKGSRVQVIVDELRGEKIDIVDWSEDPAEFIRNSLSPSKVYEVTTYDGEKKATVVVPDYQLSLAIGKEGQNARLAAKLTTWKIDIKSESQQNALMEDFDLDEEMGYYDDKHEESGEETEETADAEDYFEEEDANDKESS